MDDRELNQLLREWKAPDAPASLEAPTPPARQSWWKWLLTGSIRIPVPVGVAAAVLLAFWLYSNASFDESGATQPSTQPVVSLADFKPVDEVEVRVVGEMK